GQHQIRNPQRRAAITEAGLLGIHRKNGGEPRRGRPGMDDREAFGEQEDEAEPGPRDERSPPSAHRGDTEKSQPRECGKQEPGTPGGDDLIERWTGCAARIRAEPIGTEETLTLEPVPGQDRDRDPAERDPED